MTDRQTFGPVLLAKVIKPTEDVIGTHNESPSVSISRTCLPTMHSFSVNSANIAVSDISL